MTVHTSDAASECINFCNRTLTGLGNWSDTQPLAKACIVPIDILIQRFQTLVLHTPHERMDALWSERLTRFRSNLIIHYDSSFDPLLVAVEQCMTRLMPLPDLPILEMAQDHVLDIRASPTPVKKEHLMALLVFKKFHFKLRNIEHCSVISRDMAIFIDKLGYFPIDKTHYSTDSLDYLWSIYAKFPHLPIKGIASLQPNQNALKVHRLCENFWMYAIRELTVRNQSLPQPLGGFYAYKETEMDSKRWNELMTLQPETNSLLLGKGDSFEVCTIIPLKALHYYHQEVLSARLWKKSKVCFLDVDKEINDLDLLLVQRKIPAFDYSTTTYDSFDWLIRNILRGSEHATGDQ
jgi:hypothetical protein